MAKYKVPKIIYKPTLNANGVEIPRFKSMQWINRMNNAGNFQLIFPAINYGTSINPVIGGIILLEYEDGFYDTVMWIEKVETERDIHDTKWHVIGGRPYQFADDIMRDAKNNNYFLRHRWNGQANVVEQIVLRDPAAIIENDDILTSRVYEDTLGGKNEIVISHTWGTTVTGRSSAEFQKTTHQNSMYGKITIPHTQYPEYFYSDSRAGQTITTTINDSSDTLQIVSPPSNAQYPTITVGQAQGNQGYMNQLVYNGTWVKSDNINLKLWGQYPAAYVRVIEKPKVAFNFLSIGQAVITSIIVIDGKTFPSDGNGNHCRDILMDQYLALSGAPLSPPVSMSTRQITMKSKQEYLAEMQNFMETSFPNGSYTGRVLQETPIITGGHYGYAAEIKTYGEIASPKYNVDFFLGNTLRINDTVQGVQYDGILSGVIETIDANGYNLEFELGTLGGTIAQRLNGVI